MADGKRSPLGELVHTHMRRLSLTQGEIAQRAEAASRVGRSEMSLSERTVYAILRPAADPADWHIPRRATVEILGAVFELAPGSPAFDELMDAATAAKAVKAMARAAPDDLPPDQPPPRFIEAGREPHIARLRQEIDAAAASRPGVVFVQGDYGTGKSSLIDAVCRQAVERYPNLVTLWGSCPDDREPPQSHAPFRQILRFMVGDVADATPDRRLSATNLTRLAARAPDAARALAVDGPLLINRVLADEALWTDTLAGALDADLRRRVNMAIHGALPPTAETLSVCEQFFRVLSGYAAGGPVVLVFEDLHLGDAGTIESLTHLIQRMHLQRLPVLVIGSFRPAGLALARSRSPNTLPVMVHDASRLFLDPIVDLSTAVGGDPGRRFIDALLRRTFGDDPAGLAGMLFERTAGLPMFVTGLLQLYRQGTPIAGPPDGETTPGPAGPEIESLFTEQLAPLTPAQRSILDVASVQGDTFTAETVMEVLGHDHAVWRDLVDAQLVRHHRLLDARPRTWVAGITVHQYQFSQSMLRDHVYHLMPSATRVHYHAATADAMVALFGDDGHDATGAIAWHLDRADEPGRAAMAYLRAGVHTMILRDYPRAMSHFRRMLALPIRESDPATYIHAFIGLGNCARGKGDTAEASLRFQQAIELATHHRLPIVAAHARESMAMLDFDAGNMVSGEDRLASSIDIFLEAGERDDAARAMANLAYPLYGQGRYEDALGLAERARALAIAVGNDRIQIDAMNGRAICLIDLGLTDEALEIYRECLELSAEIGDAHREDLCWLNISLANFEMEQWARAKEAVRHVLDGPGHTSRLVGAAEFNAGVIAEGMKDTPSARTHYATSHEIRTNNGQRALLVDSLAGLLRVALTEGETGEAGTLRSEIQDRIAQKALDGIEHPGRMFVTLIEASIALADQQAARDDARRAMAFLTGRADRLSSARYRERYLGVKTHRRIVELAESLGV